MDCKATVCPSLEIRLKTRQWENDPACLLQVGEPDFQGASTLFSGWAHCEL